MNSAELNGTQVEEPQDRGPMDADVLGDETRTSEVGEGGDADKERMRRHRLRGFLRELVREEGKMEAAELLGVNYKTLDRAEKTGEITGRMGDAIERLSSAGDNPEVLRLKESVGKVEERTAALEAGVEALAQQLRDGLDELRITVAGGPDAEGGGEEGTGVDDDGEKQASWSETGAAPPVGGLRPKKTFRERRKEPEVVTVEPADEDQEVYGKAWPLIEEWRSLRTGHPNEGKSLSWLRTHERLLVLELAMLEEHGLTLPPEKQALRGFGRRGQTTWRWTALADTRKSLARREMLRWVCPWMWREKAPEFPPGPVSAAAKAQRHGR